MLRLSHKTIYLLAKHGDELAEQAKHSWNSLAKYQTRAPEITEGRSRVIIPAAFFVRAHQEPNRFVEDRIEVALIWEQV